MKTASDIEIYMLGLINAEREARGLKPLVLERNLNDSAERYSELLLDEGHFSHTGPDGSSVRERIAASTFDMSKSWSIGENLAVGTLSGGDLRDDVDGLHKGLMESPGHRANILKDDFTHVGLGIEVGDFDPFSNRPTMMITQNFGASSGVLDAQIDGTSGNDRLSGGTGDDLLRGGGGDDRLNGKSGRDRLLGDDGDDHLSGADGNDRLYGGRGDDRLYGGDGVDLLYGGDGDDKLYGSDGRDTLNGGAGRDLLRGGGGDDRLNGKSGRDRLLGDDGDDHLSGADGNDRLYGGRGDDRLYGGDGVDLLYGGDGDDKLSGSDGADVFVFSNVFGDDRIVDLEDADRIDLGGVAAIAGYGDLVRNHLEDTRRGAVIDDGAGNTITLEGIRVSDLVADDFVF